MTIDLLAFLPLDGSAFIKNKGSLLFVVAPYEKRNAQQVNKETLDKAVLKFDFHVAKERFKSWESLVQFLNTKVKEARKEQGQDISEMDLRHEIINSAPIEILNRFLDKVENELLPSLQFEHAETVILAMLDSANPACIEVICRRAGTLLRRIKEQQQAYLAERSMMVRDDSVFENLQRSGKMAEAQGLADAIRKRRSVWTFAA